MADIKIIGGMSLPRRIVIISNSFASEAKCDKAGRIVSTVRALPSFLNALLKLRLIPRVVRMIAFAMATSSPRGRVIFTLYLIGMIILNTNLPALNTTLAQNTGYLWPLFALELLIIATAFLGIKKVRPWHGAEHMAIAAYERSGLTDVGSIAKESPVNPHCGGRFLLPIVLVSAVAGMLSHKFAVNSYWIFLPLLEVALWVDKFKGFDHITPFAQVSTLLQRYITTKQPGKLEIAAAQVALEGLVRAETTKAPLKKLQEVTFA